MRQQRKVELLPQLVESLVGDAADVFLLLVDLCGSTEFKMSCIAQDQPDLTWIQRQLIFLQRAAVLVKQYEGVIVKTIGDELFAYFHVSSDPEEVLNCASEIIKGYDNLKAYKGKSKLEAKVSIDFGATYNGSILNSVPFDPIGFPVDRCARLNSIARNNEIVFSEDFLTSIEAKISSEELKSKYDYKTHVRNLKGFGKTKCYSIFVK